MERAGKLAAPKNDITVKPFSVGSLKCEAISPEFAHNPNFAVLYAHGGGYVTGKLDYARNLAAKIALATGFTTISFKYRLAPEHPYPAAFDDAMAVWEHLTSGKFQPENIFIAGDSAGGNLALCLAQKLLADKKPLPRGLLLFSPWTDMTGTAPSYEIYKDRDPILTKDYVMGAAKAYMGERFAPEDPIFSPLFGELKGLPPVYIMAGRNEILLDDSIRLKEKIASEGGKVALDIEEGGWHVYQQMPLPFATQAMKRLAAYVTSEIKEVNQNTE
ncbi:MAG: alpha/beta hydrolase [Lachnospiraceae bacterium]|nr:alpha/beta hydrolase [Lachnospiraceae bacterium]